MSKFRPKQKLAYAFWLFGFALLIPVWMGHHFPTEDGMAHLYWTEVYRALGNAGNLWGDFYERSIEWNTPNLSYFALQYALSSICEPHLAQKIIISFLILAWAAAARLLSIKLRGELTLGAFASLLLIHSSWLYGGYLPFLVGVPILLMALALLAGMLPPPSCAAASEVFRIAKTPFVILGFLGVIAYYTHFVIAALFLVLVFISILFSCRRSPRQAFCLALAALPTWLLALSYLCLSSFGSGGTRWEPLSKSIARFVGLAFFRGFATGGSAFWVALALIGVIFASLCLSIVHAIRSREDVSWFNQIVFVVTAFLVLLYFVLPEGVGQGYNLKGRLQLAMWAWLLPCLPYRLSRRARAAVFIGVSLLLSWQITDFSFRVRRFNQQYAGVLKQAEALPPGATLSSALNYEHAGFEDSFIRVLAHSPEDIAYHTRCVLIQGYHPSTAFYWVRTRSDVHSKSDYGLDVINLPESQLSLVIMNNSEGHVTQ